MKKGIGLWGLPVMGITTLIGGFNSTLNAATWERFGFAGNFPVSFNAGSAGNILTTNLVKWNGTPTCTSPTSTGIMSFLEGTGTGFPVAASATIYLSAADNGLIASYLCPSIGGPPYPAASPNSFSITHFGSSFSTGGPGNPCTGEGGCQTAHCSAAGTIDSFLVPTLLSLTC